MEVNKIYLRTCIGVKFDLPLIRHFIEHYKILGVDEFYITLSSPTEKEENLEIAKSILKEYDIEPYDVWIGPYREHIRGEYLCKMVGHLNDDEWIVTADCDEFQEYPMELHGFVVELDKDGITWVEGGVIDRVTSTGEIPEKLDCNLLLSEQFPTKCNMHRLKSGPKGGAFIGNEKYMPKVMLHKRNINLSTGNHIILNKCQKKYKLTLVVNHFKWFGDAYEKIVRIQKDDITNNPKKDGQFRHLETYGKINLEIVGVCG